MVNKKGDGLSLNFIIVAILALIALIVIALFFTGGMTKLFRTEQDVTKISLDPQIRLLSEASCNLYCTNQNENAFNNPPFPKELMDSGYTNCEQLIDKSFAACNVQATCQKSDPSSAVQGCVGTSQASCEQVAGCVWK